MQNESQSLSIGETIKSAFKLAEEASSLREQLAVQLPRIVGRDHAVCHRIYTQLGDFIIAFDQLNDRIVELRAVGRYFND